MFPTPLANSTFVSHLQWVHLKWQGQKHQHSYPPTFILLSGTLSLEFLYFPFHLFIQISRGTKRNYLVFDKWMMDVVRIVSLFNICHLLLPMQGNKIMYSILWFSIFLTLLHLWWPKLFSTFHFCLICFAELILCVI